MAFNQIESSGGSVLLSLPVFAIGTNAGSVQHTAAALYAVEGIIFTKAATNNIPLVTGTPVNLAAGFSCLYAVDIDAAGLYTVVAGKPARTADITAQNTRLEFPELPPATRTRIAIVRIVNVTNPFIPGTTALNASGVTATYFNVFQQPASPALFS